MYSNIIFASLFSAIWVIAEVRLMRIDRKQNKGSKEKDHVSRTFNIIAIVIGLAISPIFIVFPIGKKAFINSSIVLILGIIIAVAGISFRQYSIHILGKYFRTTVEIDEAHEVIQNGPYKYIRHPSYSGFIIFFIGYGLIMQNWYGLVIASVSSILALLYRIRVEELEMERGLGQEYIDYQKKTKKLIPWIW